MPVKKVEKLILKRLHKNSDRYEVKKQRLTTAEADLSNLKRKNPVLVENLIRQINIYKQELEACHFRVMTCSRFKQCE